jgi:putative transposase
MSPEERKEILRQRKLRGLPWHSPPHLDREGTGSYIISAACYEHRPILSLRPGRLQECEDIFRTMIESMGDELHAWSILPNHYHLLVTTRTIKMLVREIGYFHGRTSFQWNRQDQRVGRKTWFNCFERLIESERHFYASLNYIHNNPVKHGYVTHWQDWPYSSARIFLGDVGQEEAERLWHSYPTLDYGKGWDWE